MIVRYSSDNWKSDVMIYVSFGCICICVAGSRIKNVETITQLPKKLDHESTDEFVKRLTEAHIKQHREISERDNIDIDNPYAGSFKQFDLDNVEAAIQYLHELKSSGLHVPYGTIESIKEELDVSI